jgi:hypothetical protein
MDSSNDLVPDSIIQLQQQFGDFRSTHAGRAKLPDALWQAAVEQARQYGVHVVSQRLRLDYTALKKRLGGVSKPGQQTSRTGFVELMSAVGGRNEEYIIEFESAPNPRMRVQWKSSVPPDWSALLRAWRDVAG